MPKFEIFQSDKNHEFYFHLKANNGQKILASQGYKSKSACQNGVHSAMENASDDSHYELAQAKDGSYYFNLKAENGQVIGTSQMYKSSTGLKTGIQSVITNAIEATIQDLTSNN